VFVVYCYCISLAYLILFNLFFIRAVLCAVFSLTVCPVLPVVSVFREDVLNVGTRHWLFTPV